MAEARDWDISARRLNIFLDIIGEQKCAQEEVQPNTLFQELASVEVWHSTPLGKYSMESVACRILVMPKANFLIWVPAPP